MKAQLSAQIKMLIIELLTAVHFLPTEKGTKNVYLNWAEFEGVLARRLQSMSVYWEKWLSSEILITLLSAPLGQFPLIHLSWVDVKLRHIEILNQRHEFAASQRKNRTKTNF